MSFKIANHAIRMVFANLEDVLKLTLLPYVLMNLISFTLSYAFTGTFNWMGNGFEVNLNDPQQLAEQVLSGSMLLAFAANFIFYLVLSAWLAVGWHRFVLAEEYPDGFMPRMQRGRILPYVGRVLQLFLIAVVLALIVGIAVVAFAAILGEAVVLLALPAAIAISILYVRASLILPAISIDRTDFGVRDAFAATEGQTLVILGTVLVFSLYSIGVLLAAAAVAFVAPFLTTSFEIIFEWVFLVVGISFLTTLYGVAVERRTLG